MSHLQILLKLDRLNRRQAHENKLLVPKEESSSSSGSSGGQTKSVGGVEKTVAKSVGDIAAILPM